MNDLLTTAPELTAWSPSLAPAEAVRPLPRAAVAYRDDFPDEDTQELPECVQRVRGGL